MKYKCIKEFTVAVYDNENDCFLDENMTIKKNSTWECTHNGCIYGNNINLKNTKTNAWIETSEKILEKYFKQIA